MFFGVLAGMSPPSVRGSEGQSSSFARVSTDSCMAANPLHRQAPYSVALVLAQNNGKYPTDGPKAGLHGHRRCGRAGRTARKSGDRHARSAEGQPSGRAAPPLRDVGCPLPRTRARTRTPTEGERMRQVERK